MTTPDPTPGPNNAVPAVTPVPPPPPNPQPLPTGPCQWPIESCSPQWNNLPPEVQAYAGRIATDILWAYTMHRFGLCEVTVRPCSQPQRCGRWLMTSWGPYGMSGVLQPWIGTDGMWRNGCGGCASECGCTDLCAIRLPAPAYQVQQVINAGEVVPDTAWVLYATDTGPRLVRTDGGCWLKCQDLRQPNDGPKALTVTYLHGEPVPAGGRAAAGILAWEIAKACQGLPCQLPTRVSQVVREGLTYSYIDPLAMFKEGRVGIPAVDMWISTVNPYGVVRAGAVFSPDVRKGYEVRQSNPAPWINVPTPPPTGGWM